jgi:hypothetical protein
MNSIWSESQHYIVKTEKTRPTCTPRGFNEGGEPHCRWHDESLENNGLIEQQQVVLFDLSSTNFARIETGT